MSTDPAVAFERLSAASLRLSGSGSVRVSYERRRRDSPGSYTAVIECKPRAHRYRLLRETGSTLTAALRRLEGALEAFEAGELEGEQ